MPLLRSRVGPRKLWGLRRAPECLGLEAEMCTAWLLLCTRTGACRAGREGQPGHSKIQASLGLPIEMPSPRLPDDRASCNTYHGQESASEKRKGERPRAGRTFSHQCLEWPPGRSFSPHIHPAGIKSIRGRKRSRRRGLTTYVFKVTRFKTDPRRPRLLFLWLDSC